ncbi:hypothetical protein ETB97_000129 [Aspergillus alliaceus]|uniref:GPI anchored protein n=1 Tax=Petromyces alliaceus TaxID=209559 RepID=A0A8H6ED26_PETAA|nr:hypothetical protein ETB97_000129 [Aspergillus burnettii]
MVSKSSLNLLMFLAVLLLAVMVPAMDVTEDLGNVYDDDHLLGIPTFDEPRTLVPRNGFVIVTVTDTVCGPPPAGGTTSQGSGTIPGAPGTSPAPTVTTASETTVVTGTGPAGPIPTGTGPTGTSPTGASPTVTDTVITGTTTSTETQSSPSTETATPSPSTASSSVHSTTRSISSHSTGQSGTATATISGSQTATAAPTPNEATSQRGAINALLVLAVTCAGFLMI